MVGGRVVYRRGGFAAPPPPSIGTPRPPSRPRLARRGRSQPPTIGLPRRRAAEETLARGNAVRHARTARFCKSVTCASHARHAQVRRCILQRASSFAPRSPPPSPSLCRLPQQRCQAALRRRRRAGARAVRRRQQPSPATAAKPTARMTPSTGGAGPTVDRVPARDATRRWPAGVCAGHRRHHRAAHHRRQRARPRQDLPRRPGARRRRRHHPVRRLRLHGQRRRRRRHHDRRARRASSRRA